MISHDGSSGPLQEIEPNDNAAQADYIGELRVGDLVEIEGHITECCPDPFDGFAFFVEEPVELRLSLVEFNLAADLDFCIYDPTVGSVVACWETDSHPEVGLFAFSGPGELHAVIASYLNDSHYRLTIEVLDLQPFALSAGSLAAQSAPTEAAAQRFAEYSQDPFREKQPALQAVELPWEGGVQPSMLGIRCGAWPL